MNDADGSPNEAWVTVFGFPPGSLAAVLEAFQRDGDVVTHDSFASYGAGEWFGGANAKTTSRDPTGCTCGSRRARGRRGRFDVTGPR